MRSSRGLSLFELLLSMAILSVLVLAGLTGLHIVRAQKQKLSMATLTAALRYAQLQAVLRQQSVYLCAVRGMKCQDHFRGERLHVFLSGKGGRRLLRVYCLPKGVGLDFRGFGAEQQIRWLANGMPDGQNGRFCLRGQSPCLVLAKSGSVHEG